MIRNDKISVKHVISLSPRDESVISSNFMFSDMNAIGGISGIKQHKPIIPAARTRKCLR